MTDIFTQLEHLGLPNVASLYREFIAHPDTDECGSSSISPEFADSCAEIRYLLKTKAGIVQKNESNNDAWAAMGDKSGILYFGGRKAEDSEKGHRWVAPKEYLETLILLWPELSDKAAAEFESLCGAFVEFIKVANDPDRCRPIELSI
jgi:hypothetical protein